MIAEIQLLDSDYFDCEQERYVLTYGNDAVFYSEAKITDHDGIVWDCYLIGVKYFKKTDQYEAYYKRY